MKFPIKKLCWFTFIYHSYNMTNFLHIPLEYYLGIELILFIIIINKKYCDYVPLCAL